MELGGSRAWSACTPVDEESLTLNMQNVMTVGLRTAEEDDLVVGRKSRLLAVDW